MWFELAVLSMLAYGLLDFLFKVAEENKLDFSNVLLYYYWTAAFVAFTLFVLFPEPILNFPFLAFIAVGQVSLYLMSNVLKLESLRHLKSVVAYPLFALHGVAAAILAFLFLNESLSGLQSLGIAVSVIAILLLVEKHHKFKINRGILLALGAMLFLAASETVVAAVIDNLVILPFIGLSYFFALGPSFMLEKHMHKRGSKKGTPLIGLVMGVTNIVAFYCLLLALQTGPASIIFPVIALALLASIILSMVIYKETLSKKKMLAVGLALLAIILMRI